MQGADPDKNTKSSGDEESINFRPSPNFKHMKKYLKSKFEEAIQMANNPSNEVRMESPTSSSQDERPKGNSTQLVQPPLPPNPPPDSPPLTLKQEVVDEDYSSAENVSDPDQYLPMNVSNIKTDQVEETPVQPEVTMCRNFVRGTCRKGGSCIFAHELILSQLPGVYTFCRNFQNSVCTLPKCKFVHATVFEKEYFYRTGFLPPHALQHLTEGFAQQPSPPSPPEETPREVPAAPVYANGLPAPCIVPVPQINGGPEHYPDSTSQTFSDDQTVPGPSTKREWMDNDDMCSSPDLVTSETVHRGCTNCESNKIRYHLAKTKLEKSREACAEIYKKKCALEGKRLRLKKTMDLILSNNNFTMAEQINIFLSARQNEGKRATKLDYSDILAKVLRKVEKRPPDSP